MTVSNRSWRLRGAFIAAAASVVGVGLCAVPAQAHTPAFTVDCSSGSVDLKAYNAGVANTVTISVDGKSLVDAQKFGSAFHKDLTLDKASVETVRLVVKAGDGQQYSLDQTKTSLACEGTPSEKPTPSASAPTEAPSSEAPAPSESASDSPSAAAPAPAPSSSAPTDLAETGSSSSTPLIAGAAAVVILAGGGIMFAARKRRSGQN